MEGLITKQSLSSRIYYEITSTCNLKCTHCSELLEEQPVKQIDANKLIEFQKKIAKIGVNNCVVTGGEPSIHSEFYYIIEELAKIGQVSITSNGILIDKEKISKLMHKYPNIYLQLSMDGVSKEVYESIRGKNTFNKLISLIKHLKSMGLQKQVGISMTIMQKNMHEVKQMIKFAEENELAVVHFPALLPVGASRRKWSEIAPDVDTQIKIEDEIGKVMTEENVKIPLSANRIEQIITKISSNGQCDCINNLTLKVVPNGEILPCPATSNLDYSIGNISDENIIETLMDRLQKKRSQFITAIGNELESCKSCKVKKYCNSRFCANCSLLSKPDKEFCNYYCKIIMHHLNNALEEMGDYIVEA